MKKLLKESVFLFLAIIMVICAIPFAGGTFEAMAESEEFTEGYYTYEVENDEATIISCDKSISGDVVIPSELGGYPVVGIGDSTFEHCIDLTSIIIPDGVASIGSCAFGDCTSLNSVEFSKDLSIIDKRAFSNCKNLQDLYIPEGVETICGQAFEYCKNLKSVYIPSSVTSMSGSVFKNCSSLENLTVSPQNQVYRSVDNCIIEMETKKLIVGCSNSIIPSDGSVVTIASAFDGRDKMTDVVIPNTVESIYDYSFSECINLSNIKIPNSVTYLGSFAFQSCGSLTNIIIPDSVITISSHVFCWCLNLKNITIGKNVNSIGSLAFYHCPKLTSVIIPKSVTKIGNAAFGYFDYFGENTVETRKIPNFTIYGYTGTAAETYANKNGFTFVALDDEHTHTFSAWTVTTEANCTAEGVETRTCSGCGATETRKTEKKEHSLTHVEEDSTCKIQGVSYDICDMCGNTFNYSVLPLAPHTFGEWRVTKEATSFEYGERMRSCSVCGFEEKERIEKLPVSEIKDEKTGISVICPDGSYDGKVEIEVTETFDGTSYHVLNTEKGNFKKSLFDITTTIDGEKVQPNGTVFVKIPLPDGYNAEKTVVYYVTNDGKLEKIESEVKDGYIIFETTHFSFYAVVDESSTVNPSQNCSCACHKKGIAKFFFKIKLIFQKIFKKNKLCKCGVNHY